MAKGIKEMVLLAIFFVLIWGYLTHNLLLLSLQREQKK